MQLSAKRFYNVSSQEYVCVSCGQNFESKATVTRAIFVSYSGKEVEGKRSRVGSRGLTFEKRRWNLIVFILSYWSIR